jgi:hypothetical protein
MVVCAGKAPSSHLFRILPSSDEFVLIIHNLTSRLRSKIVYRYFLQVIPLWRELMGWNSYCSSTQSEKSLGKKERHDRFSLAAEEETFLD